MRLQFRLLSLLIPAVRAAAQQPDTTIHRLAPTVVTAARVHGGVTRLGDDSAGHVYTGATTSLLQVNALGANDAGNVTREVLGRIPGATFSETRGAGFPSDGIGFRGLTPTQSIELNIRQNGVNIAADLYGYSEAYYTPPIGNITQAYRPVTYDNLTPFANTARVDPHLRDAKGYTSDVGLRGHVGPLRGDVDAFYLWYGDRIGTVAVNDSVLETTNVADSRHYGIESYLEIELLDRSAWHLSLFDSFAWVQARYVNGPYRGNRVEYAPPITDRVGPTLGYGPVATTGTWSHTARQYGDASNVVADRANAGVGAIPAYDVYDWSARVGIGPRYQLQLGVDNFTNVRYFTFRTGEYPGPGIIPASGRSAYLGLVARF